LCLYQAVLGKKEKRPFLSQKVAERFNHRSEELAKLLDNLLAQLGFKEHDGAQWKWCFTFFNDRKSLNSISSNICAIIFVHGAYFMDLKKGEVLQGDMNTNRHRTHLKKSYAAGCARATASRC
jgi:hypothetical protein